MSLLNLAAVDVPPLAWEAVNRCSAEDQLRCERFLAYEALLLDDHHRLWDWFELLDEDYQYLVPLRSTRERRSGKSEFSSTACAVSDDLAMVRRRVERLDTEHAWAEEPPSRIRRVVSNVLVTPAGPAEQDAVGRRVFDVQSSFLLYRSRLNDASGELVAGTRRDLLIDEGDRMRLRRRVVFLDHTTLPTINLSFFL
jgi:3-phenylpropionate/cinnamic acid dioxygenase small subunit